ncbi:hypothetical protein D1872_263400 [compost metagenome]
MPEAVIVIITYRLKESTNINSTDIKSTDTKKPQGIQFLVASCRRSMIHTQTLDFYTVLTLSEA